MRRILLVLVLAMLLTTATAAPPRTRTASAAAPPPGTIATFAGGGLGDGGPPTSAVLNDVYGVAMDSAGDLYIADWLNCRVRKVAGGIISTVAGNGSCTYGGDGGPATSAGLSPVGVALDNAGDLYIADWGNCRVRKVAGGIITTVAGGIGGTVAGAGACGYGGDGGPATSAGLNQPSGVAVDSAGDLYIADTVNCLVRKVAGGIITTVAGVNSAGTTSGCRYAGDGGPATSAALNWPSGVAVDSAGNLYIADTNNCRVRKVVGGIITTVAGMGTGYPSSCGYAGDGGPATSASLRDPHGVAVDSAGNLYIADTNNCRVRTVAGGIITTVAGVGTGVPAPPTNGYGCGYAGDGGPATSASLNLPNGVAVDSAGNVYIADTFNCRIRAVAGGIITTVAGTGACTSGGGDGPATSATLDKPNAVAADSAGNVSIADTFNCRIRTVAGGIITSVAGNGLCGYSGDGGPATSASLNYPSGTAVDSAGNLYIADTLNCRVRKLTAGTISTIAGNGLCGYSGDGGPATGASLNVPSGVAVDSAGNLYVADAANCRVRKVAGGVITTVAGTGVCGFGGDGGPGVSAPLNQPAGVAVDGAGNLYIADTFNCRVRELAGSIITTVAGTGAGAPLQCGYGGDGGPATSASLNQPYGVAVDSAGSLYIAGGCRVRKVAGGIISTIAGTGTCTYGGDGGPATIASVDYPNGMAVDTVGNLYIADTNNNRVRVVYPSSSAQPASAPPSATPASVGGVAEVPQLAPRPATVQEAGGSAAPRAWLIAAAAALLLSSAAAWAWRRRRRTAR